MPDRSTKLRMGAEYTAGLIDGEGTVSLIRQRRSLYRSPTVSVSSTSFELIEYLIAEHGGRVVTKKKIENNKQAWEWRLDYDRALDFLVQILPHMREKKKIRRAQYLLDRYKRVTRRNGKYTDLEREEKLKFEDGFFSL